MRFAYVNDKKGFRMNVKKIYRAVLALLLLVPFAIALPGSARAETDKTTMRDVEKQMAEALEAIKHYSADQRDEAVGKAKTAMDALDAKIDELERSIHKNWGKMDQVARTKAQATLKELKRQRKQMAKSYGALKRSSKGAWEHVKQGFSDSYTDLHNAWEKAEKEFDGGK
jgi:hypothetical protein